MPILSYSGPLNVLVLTYNGEAFIAEQLHSIFQQLSAADTVVISDDGSTDATLVIAQEIAQGYQTKLHIYQGPSKGVILNFFSALPHLNAPYCLVADQDDIWLPNKVTLFREAMNPAIKHPHLVFSDAWVWQPETDQKTLFWAQQHINPQHSHQLRTMAFRNCVQGASMAINQSLIQLLTQKPAPKHAMMHDWWCSLVAASIGTVTAIPEPTLLYRQHSTNQVGALVKRTFTQKRLASSQIFHQSIEFLQCYSDELSSKDYAMLTAFQKALQKGTVCRSWFLLKYRPVRSNWLKSVTLWASILLHKGT